MEAISPSGLTVDASDPRFYTEANRPAFLDIHAADPVYWVQAARSQPFWNVCRHDHIRTVGQNPALYSPGVDRRLRGAAGPVPGHVAGRRANLPAVAGDRGVRVAAGRLRVGDSGKLRGISAFDTDQLHALVPFAGTLGMRVVEATPDAVRLELDFDATLCTAAATMHGGALMSLADTAGAVAAVLNLPEGATGTTTLESKTNLTGAVRGGTVRAQSTILHRGRSVIVVETELHTDRLVAKTAQTQLVLT